MTSSTASIFVLLMITTSILTQAFTSVHYINNKQRRSDVELQVEPVIIAGAVITAGGAMLWLSGGEDRAKRAKYAEWEAKEREIQEERRRLAHIEPRDVWTEEELRPYDGSVDDSGPILLAVKGEVFNVWKGRNFYGNGGEYSIMAGRDATRFLAKNKLDEETEEERKVALNIGERANLEAWYWIIRNKYDLVGNLKGYDPQSTEMRNVSESDAGTQSKAKPPPWEGF